jgi:eukaryotic-like serine/threonine-protein kinase
MKGERTQTKAADHPVRITGLPGWLEAYPVYRITMRDDQERHRSLLRLEIRTADPDCAERGEDAVRELDEPTRAWLLRHRAGKAAVISRRLGADFMPMLYSWCTSGIVTLTVQPPSRPGGEHGPLISWQLTAAVARYADELDQNAKRQQQDLHEQTEAIVAHLAGNQDLEPLARALTQARDVGTLDYLIKAAQSITSAMPSTSDGPADGWDAGEKSRLSASENVLRRIARGSYRDYSLDSAPLARGGQATVTEATHKLLGARVAYKKVKFRDEESLVRMRREIEVGRLLGSYEHVMPVLDASPDSDWFVMPLAAGSARKFSSELREYWRLSELVTEICAGLSHAHQRNWIHRDLKPENILRLRGYWTVADWGIAKRPHGQTSEPGRTRTRTLYGTLGYAAPELSVNAHQAGPSADIYSIGQIIGSILTGVDPQANIPLLPPQGPWRSVVVACTQSDPLNRPQTVDDLLALVAKGRVSKQAED